MVRYEQRVATPRDGNSPVRFTTTAMRGVRAPARRLIRFLNLTFVLQRVEYFYRRHVRTCIRARAAEL